MPLLAPSIPGLLVASYAGDGTTTTIDVQNIPQTAWAISLEATLRTDLVATTETLSLALNNDTTNGDYDSQNFQGVNATASATDNNSTRQIGTCCAASATAGEFGQFRLLIYNYASASVNKVADGASRLWTSHAAGAGIYRLKVCRWNSTAAINRVTITAASNGNFVAGSKAKLFVVGAA